jgi:hypothetical protein
MRRRNEDESELRRLRAEFIELAKKQDEDV